MYQHIQEKLMFWLLGWKPPTKYQCHGQVDYKLHPLSIRKKWTKNMFRIFPRMGAHEEALIIDAPQVFSPVSAIVLWAAKLWKHPICASWLTKEDFTRSFGAQTLWGTTIRCRGGAKRVENPGAVEQFWTLTDKSRVICKCNQMFVETDVGLALSSEFTRNIFAIFATVIAKRAHVSISSFDKTTWWNRLFFASFNQVHLFDHIFPCGSSGVSRVSVGSHVSTHASHGFEV